jgi:hypothetical protein
MNYREESEEILEFVRDDLTRQQIAVLLDAIEKALKDAFNLGYRTASQDVLSSDGER